MSKIILHILPNLISGGVEKSVIEMCNFLSNNKYKIFILTNQFEAKSHIHRDISIIKYNVSSKNPIKIIKAILFLINFCNHNQIDIIHTHSRIPAIISYFANLKIKKGLVNSVHGLYEKDNFLYLKYSSFSCLGDKIIAVSNFAANYIRDYFLLNKKNINLHVIENSVDIDLYNKNNVTVGRINEILKYFNIDSNKKILFFPARLVKIKGHKFLLDAIRKIDRSDFQCIISGDIKKNTKYYLYLLSLIKKYDILEKVRIVDHVKDIQAAYLVSYLSFSLSIKPEAFGRIPLESGAMSRPCIVTNIGPYLDNVVNTKNGWIVNVNNVIDLVNTINRALDLTTEEWNDMCNFSRKYIEQNFIFKNNMNKLIELYNTF